jgi:predicted Zn-dependent protease
MKLKLSTLGFALMLALFSASPPADDIEKIQLPDMGDSSGTLISPAQEKELGEAFFRQLHAQVQINEDVEISHYIQSVGRSLVLNSDVPTQPFYFFVVVDNNINAFAGPGGYIGVNAGLFLMTEAESELTSVMAHEIAHVTQRHLYRAFEAASRLSIPTAAATLAAILLGIKNPSMGQAAIMAIQAGNVQAQIDFTRENEQEADRIGMQTLVAANYDPRSMPTFFERLEQSTRFHGAGVPEFLRTHPVTVSRISDTRGRAEQYPYRQYPDSLNYALIKAKLRVLTTTDNAATLRYFQNNKFQGLPEQRAVAQYGEALMYLKMQKTIPAEMLLQPLLAHYPDQPHYVTAMARVALEAKQYDKALKLYQQAIKRFPSNYAVKFEYVTSLLKAGQPKQAQQVLQSLSSIRQEKLLYLEFMSQSYADLKQQAQSHRYLAEYYYAIGSTETAILQIKLAQKMKPIDHYLAEILEDRLQFFMAEQIQQHDGQEPAGKQRR